MTKRPAFGGLCLCFLVVFPAVALPAAPEIFLREEPETYLVIDKLSGLGLLPGLMTGDRGLEAREAAREADKASRTEEPFTDGMLRLLQVGAARNANFRIRLGAETSENGEAPPNAQGMIIPKDGGLRAGGFFRWAPVDRLAVQARGDLVSDLGDDTTGLLEETSVRIGWPQATLEAGRFSLWWGPGRHGALLFTTNAPPLTGIRFRNPRPIPLGWPLKILGAIQYDFFIARLEGSRPVPHTLLSGIRVAVRPGRYLEIGASRAIHYGGSGRGNGLSAWWDAFRGEDANDSGTNENQLGGGDISVTLPFKIQPVQLYLEAAGEDQARGHVIPLPSKWAYLGGVFLPSILGSPRWDFRIEIATNHLKGNGPAWYIHSQPEYAHRYRGRILGHPMGTDARSEFFEAHFFLLPSSYIEVNLDTTERFSPGTVKESSRRVTGAFVGWLTRNLRAEGRIGFARISGEGGVTGKDSRDNTIQAGLAWQYR